MLNEQLVGDNALVEQYVMAYRADWDEIKKLLPEGYKSLRPVLRINVEVLSQVQWLAGDGYYRVELNTPVEYQGKKGWLNLATWENNPDSVVWGREALGVPKHFAELSGKETKNRLTLACTIMGFEFLDIEFSREGTIGGCPKENDNEGTFHVKSIIKPEGNFEEQYCGFSLFVPVEIISKPKEFCECTFHWNKPKAGAKGGTFLSKAILEKVAVIKCEEILGAYAVEFKRKSLFSNQKIL